MNDELFKGIAEIKKLYPNIAMGSMPWHWAHCYEMYDGNHWAIEGADDQTRVIDASLILLLTKSDWFNKPADKNPNWRYIMASCNLVPKLITEFDALVVALAGKDAEIIDLKTQLSLANTDKKCFRSLVEALEDVKNEQKEKLVQLQEDNNLLKQAVSRASEKIVSLEDQLAETERWLIEAQDTCKALGQAAENLATQLADEKALLAHAMDKINDLEAELAIQKRLAQRKWMP